MKIDSLTLAEVGEFRLIAEIVLPLAEEFGLGNVSGDDCVFVQAAGTLAVSADVGPTPLLRSLAGYADDVEAAGWLAVVATASDIATAGAIPLFLANCIDAPADLKVNDLRKFLRGAFRACAAFGFANGGGDLRQGTSLQIRTFGAGLAPDGIRLGRSGAASGDQLVLIGPAGRLMACYLLARAGHPAVLRDGALNPETEEILRFPEPQFRAMPRLAQRALLTATSDTSDGLIGAIENIARASCCGFELELTRDMLSSRVIEAAEATGYDPWNIYAAWGDWSVVAVVAADRMSEFEALCRSLAIAWTRLGRATARPGSLTARVDGAPPAQLVPVMNENFVSHGFNARLNDHLRYILETELFVRGDS